MGVTDNYWLIRRHPDGGYAVMGVEHAVSDAYAHLHTSDDPQGDKVPAERPDGVTVVRLDEGDDAFDVPVQNGAKRFESVHEAEDWVEANNGYFQYCERHPECNISLALVGKVEELWGGGEKEWTADADPYTHRQIAIYRKNGVEYRCGCDTYEPCYCYEAALEQELGRVRGVVAEFCDASAETYACAIESLQAERDRWREIAVGLAETSRHGVYCPSHDEFGCDDECGVGGALAAYETEKGKPAD